MATLVYQYNEEEQAQFLRLKGLGFEKTDCTANRDDPQLRFKHKQLLFDFTFLPEGVTFENDDETNFWKVEVYRTSLSEQKSGTAHKWLTMTEFNTLIDPERWAEMTAALQSLECLEQWHEVMTPLLTGGKAGALPPIDPLAWAPFGMGSMASPTPTLQESMGVDQEKLQAEILNCFAAYGTEATVGIDTVAAFCEQQQQQGVVLLALIDLEETGALKIHREQVGKGEESVMTIHVSLTEAGKEQLNVLMDQREQEDEALIQQAITHDFEQS